ncbi:MAG: YcaO-related McrA-glycine thioamidation protein [Candidatus Verstraetearchaeota archaeon]|nr:YcaO-related McrA-glycine thioamidation protein [Candidatus Verstraetearchaeota archaeon]
MILNSVLKGYMAETHRVRPPEDTLRRVKEVTGKAGITRVADITGLDRLGIPIFTSIRPGAQEGAVTVYTGKGCTPQEAEVSAIMEGMERFSAEPGALTLIKGSYDALKGRYNVLDPVRLIIPKIRMYAYKEELEWVKGYSVTNEGSILVPAEAAFHPYERRNQLFRTNTNGLAVGNVVEEAAVHGLMEVIERDAWSLFEGGVARDRDVDLSGSNNALVKEILKKLEAASIKVYAKDITSDVGITTIGVAIDDETTRDPALLSLGVGTHLIPEVAALRALTEAVQSRLTTIHGTREDTFKAEFARRIGYERMKRLNKRWFTPSDESVRLEDLASVLNQDFLEDIKYTVKRLTESGFGEVILVDLTKPDLRVPAVRVIVPGMEVYALDKDRMGERLRTRLCLRSR